jgi:dTDP-4-amino-4,6-dideoxygalactose transaminase
MPISRGSIKHSLCEDLTNLIKVYLNRGLTGRASDETRQRLKDELRNRFSVEHVELFPYARTAFYSALVSLNLPKGSKVLMTPITIGPMLEIVINLGYEPIFVDIELETFGPDLDNLKSKLQEGPSCFLLTYLFGYVPDVGKIAEMCKLANCTLLEDISHNIGANYDGKPLGTFGAVGIYSASLLKYVDGYNGAFSLTNSEDLADRMTDQASKLLEPNPRRIREGVRRTFIWNLALSRCFFTFVTYPMLWCLKLASPERFERLLGPSIKLDMYRELPGFWFEDISEIQCKTIFLHLKCLESLLQSRRRTASEANTAFADDKGKFKVYSESVTASNGNLNNTFWQYVIRVRDVEKARDHLFHSGLETGTTNLMDIANAYGTPLINATALKKSHIFIPLHAHLLTRQYLKVVQTLSLLECDLGSSKIT